MNSFFNNNQQATAYGQWNNGMTYGQPQKELMWTNALTPEEEKALHKGPSSLSLDIPKEDMWRAKCTHRDPASKQFTIRENGDGTVTCLKCGATFNVVDKAAMEEIKKVIGGTIDILQTTKMAYIDMTPEVVQSYFVILPFLEIAPKLYEAAMNTLNNAVPGMGMTNNFVPGDMFQMLNQAVGTMGMPMGGNFMNQPMPPMGYPQQPQYAQPNYGQMPMQQVPFNQNPLQTQYTPQQMQQQQPVQTQPQPAQQAAPAPKEGDTAKVSRTFDLG